MIFCFICFLGRCSNDTCGFFQCRRATFSYGVITISMNSFLVVRRCLQNAFLFSHLKYDIDGEFLIVNYCYFFALFVVDIFLIILLNQPSILYPVKLMTRVSNSYFLKILASPNHYFFPLRFF